MAYIYMLYKFTETTNTLMLIYFVVTNYSVIFGLIIRAKANDGK